MDDQDIKYKKMGIVDGLRLKKESMTYTELAKETGVNKKELCYMVNRDGYEPPAWVWAKFGLHVTKEVPLCPTCGGVHIKKGCPAKRPKNPNRTPGGWVNGKDPARAAKQLEKMEYSLEALMFHLALRIDMQYMKEKHK